MNKKGGYQQRSFYSGGHTKYYQQNPGSFYNHNPESGPSVCSYGTIPNRTDVGYTGGGGAPGRVSLGVTSQFTSVATPHPPNSTPQVQQQSSQNHQLRAQAPPLPPSQHPHNSTGGPPPPVSHSQHLPHPHSTAIVQHQHHSVLSSGNVSGATGGIGNHVQQSGVAAPPGQNQAPPGPPHELNTQGIPQPTSQQLQQGSGVALTGNVSGTHSMMYPGNHNAHHTQQPNVQVRRPMNGQFFPPGQQNTTHLIGAGQQHRQQVMAHTQPNIQGYYSSMIPQMVHPSSHSLYPQLAPIPPHRPGTSSNQSHFPQFSQGTFHHSHIFPMQAGFPQLMDNNVKAWNVKNQYSPTQAVFFSQHQPAPPKAPAAAAPTQREKNIIPIIDPLTNKNILDDMPPAKPSHSPSPMQSRDSSAANTPAPGEPTQIKSQPISVTADFTLQESMQVDNTCIANEQHFDHTDSAISTNKSIEPSQSVLNSESREKDRLLNSVDCKADSVIGIQSTRSVPEHISINKAEPSQPPQSFQPPPQPQRPAKQSRAAQVAATAAASAASNVTPVSPASSIPTSAPPPHVSQAKATHSPHPTPKQANHQPHGKQQAQAQHKGANSSPKGTQGGQGQHQQQQQSKGTPSASNAQQGQQPKATPAHVPQQQQQNVSQSKQSLPQVQQPQQQQQQNQQQQQQQNQHQQSKVSTEGAQTMSRAVPQQVPPPQHVTLSNQGPPMQMHGAPSQGQQHAKSQPQASMQMGPSHPQQGRSQQPQGRSHQGQVQFQAHSHQQQQGPAVPQQQQSHSHPQSQQNRAQQQQPQHSQGHIPSQPQQPQPSPQSHSQVQPGTQQHSHPQKGSHGPNYRGPSPPQQSVISQKGSRKLSGEQPPPSSAAPVKSGDKHPPVEVPSPSVPVASDFKEMPSRQIGTKSASPSPVPSTKKEATPEPNQPSGKKGKEKNEDSQPKEAKELPKTPVEDASPRVAPEPSQPISTKSQGKPPKTQPSSNEKGAEIVQPPPATPSHAPKSESPIPHAVGQPKNLPPPPPSAEVPPQSSSKDSGESSKKENLEHVNNIDEPEVSNHEENHVGNKVNVPVAAKYPIKEAQPGPDNSDGKLQYDRDYLFELRNNPLSLKRPDSLPNLEVVLDGPNKPIDAKSKIALDFTPSFLQTSARNRNQKVVSRNSQQGRRGGHQKIIDIKLSGNTDVKLKTSENAWKPSSKVDYSGDKDVKHEETLKKIRGILNKLTPDNFYRLVEQVKNLKIEKFETFDGVIDLIFEKAVDEQAFSTTYAELCKVLSLMSVKVQEKGGEARFRNLIISRCQTEFEKDNSKDLNRVEREKEIEAETDREKKAEMKALLDFEETRLRKRSVGNIRFIGELYKLKMLTSSIMMKIIIMLLNKKDEESLECLCKLLTTIGKSLEASAQGMTKAQGDLNEMFESMRSLVNSKSTSSRVRFLMMDVLDLGKNDWVPRREDAKPKTKAQVHEEIRKEEQQQSFNLQSSSTPRKDDRERKRSRDNRNMSSDDGWSTVNANARRVPFDSNRLKNTTFTRNTGMDANIQLRAGFGNWARGSSGGSNEKDDEARNSTNKFSVLDSDKLRTHNLPQRYGQGGNYHRQGTGSFGSKSMPPPDKENLTSLTPLSNAGDRSKSNSRSNSRTGSRERTYPVVDPIKRETRPPLLTLNRENAELFSTSIIEEYVHNFNLKEAVECIHEKFDSYHVSLFIEFSLSWVLDRDGLKRKRAGILYHHLLLNKHVTLAQFEKGSKPLLEQTMDLEIDIPAVCTYFGEILCHLLNDNVVSMEEVLKLLEPAEMKQVILFAKILKQASLNFGENRVGELWKESGLSWEKLLPGTDVNSFLKQHEIEFANVSSLNDPNMVRTKLKAFFKGDPPEEEIFAFIEKNFGGITKTKKFVRALTIALIENLLDRTVSGKPVVPCKGFEDILRNRTKIIHKYVQNDQALELNCIYGMQALCIEYQHPPGLLEHAFNIFYENDVLSDDSFFEWKKDDDPMEQCGKGVCLTSVSNFFKWIESEDPEPQE